MNIKLGLQLLKNMGLRYTTYRIFHELDKKSGLLKKRHPTNPELRNFISLENWKKSKLTFIFESRETILGSKIPNPQLAEKANKILQHHTQFFSNQWIDLGKDYDWITNPDTHYKYDISNHWSNINDFNQENGDIKYVWEKSRFSFLLTLIRYDYHFEKDSSEFVFQEINSWIDANPINQGPNWKCSQEISLRTFNWLYAIYFYKNSDFLTEALWQKMMNVLYWQMHHVYHHIDFSRIAVRNNHAITETLALSLTEILFPFFEESKKWSKKGRKYFEQEINYQIYPDGAFIQHSMNYHRVLIQLLSFGLSITQKANKPFSENVYKKAYKTLGFLYQFIQPKNGNLPNYGHNDGALFFPLSDAEFRDYRSQLNTLHQILTAKPLFETAEDFFSFSKPIYNFKSLELKFGITSFTNSGYYLFRTNSSFTFVKCSNYKDRPAQSDNLHIDIWHNGENVIRDSGSYKYNTDEENSNYFFGTKSHNTVMIENHNQMLKGGRFIWYYWPKNALVTVNENEDEFIFNGAVNVFSFIDKKCKHTRKITISKTHPNWIIEDTLTNSKNKKCYQIWNCNPNIPIDFEAVANSQIVIANEYSSFYSSLYGQKEEQKGYSFEFDSTIKTEIKLLNSFSKYNF